MAAKQQPEELCKKIESFCYRLQKREIMCARPPPSYPALLLARQSLVRPVHVSLFVLWRGTERGEERGGSCCRRSRADSRTVPWSLLIPELLFIEWALL